jgi:DNA mismatch repair protein MutS2
MDERTLRVLEYDKIRELLSRQAACALGREKAAAHQPAGEPQVVARLLEETSQARAAVAAYGSAPLGGIRDVRRPVAAAAKGGMLEPSELLDVADTLFSARRLRGFLLSARQEAPELAEMASGLGDFRQVEDEVGRCISPRAEVVDEASEALRAAREQVRRLHDTITLRLETMLRSPHYQRMIQEPIVTLRSDRFCLPVRSEFKSEFRGIIHDLSASGATVFMEPFVVVELNNQLREARLREEEEVGRVLARLSAGVGDRAEELEETLELLGELDFIFARAALGRSMDASAPVLDGEGGIELWSARHPLLPGAVVPIEVRLGKDFLALILTGPNTGGKTVTLKTIGLLTLMAQSGLHIPAAPGSRIVVFSSVFADIGDEQSVTQSLSTFSSHMNQIVRVMQEAGPRSLALLDEIGAGTDPAEGSALAKAVLGELVRRGTRVVATTHYGELKSFAYAHPALENASMEFDPVSLKPTFHVRLGLPGSSHAFEIARRLGLPESVLAAARESIAPTEVALDEIIHRVEADQRALAQERLGTEVEREKLRQVREEYEALLADLKRRRGEQLKAAREEAKRVIAGAKQHAESLLDLLRQAAQEARRQRPEETALVSRTAREELAEISGEVEAATREAEPETATEREAPPRPLGAVKLGDEVYLRSVGQKGTVLALPDEAGELLLQVGILKIKAQLSDLERPARVEPAAGLPDELGVEAKHVPREIHLRGLRVEEAVYQLEQYLDDALVAGLPEVRIVHGKGTGAVRQAVQELLAHHPAVESFRLGEEGEGDAGVTVARLRG